VQEIKRATSALHTNSRLGDQREDEGEMVRKQRGGAKRGRREDEAVSDGGPGDREATFSTTPALGRTGAIKERRSRDALGAGGRGLGEVRRRLIDGVLPDYTEQGEKEKVWVPEAPVGRANVRLV